MDDSEFSPGDAVRVTEDEELAEENHHDWFPEMRILLNKIGYVKKLEDDNVRIYFGGISWNLDPSILIKLSEIDINLLKDNFNPSDDCSEGDIVQVLNNRSTIESQQTGSFEPWNDSMFDIIGKCGHVTDVNVETKGLYIKIIGEIFCLNPKCVTKLASGLQSSETYFELENLKEHSFEKHFYSEYFGFDSPSTLTLKLPLMKAALNGDLNGFKETLKLPNMNINQKENGQSALHIASKNGHIDIVKLLIGTGADLAIKNRDKDSPLHLSVRAKQVEVVRILLESGSRTSSLERGATSEPHNTSVDINAQNQEGNTPVHEAISNSSETILQMLLSHRASVTIFNKRSLNPLHVAAIKGNNESVKLLLEHCPEIVDIKTNEGSTALHLASSRRTSRHLRVMKTVQRIESAPSANPNSQNNKGNTPLHIAAKKNNVQAVKQLVRENNNIDINIQDFSGESVLHKVMRNVSKTYFEMFRDDDSDSSLEFDAYSMVSQSKKIAIFLVERGGVDIGIKNKKRETAFDVCDDDKFKLKLSHMISGTRQLKPAVKPLLLWPATSSEGCSCGNSCPSSSSNRCGVCLEKEQNMVYQCGHMFCDQCSSRVAVCPTCRVPISQRIRVYR